MEILKSLILRQGKTAINPGYLLCALSLILMGILSIVAQGTVVVSMNLFSGLERSGGELSQLIMAINESAWRLRANPHRIFMMLGVYPFIISIVFYTGVIWATVKERTIAYGIASLLSLPYFIITFLTFAMVGRLHTEIDVFDIIIQWSPTRSPFSFVSLFYGMVDSIVLGPNFFGIRDMAIVVPIITGVALACGGFQNIRQSKVVNLEGHGEVEAFEKDEKAK